MRLKVVPWAVLAGEPDCLVFEVTEIGLDADPIDETGLDEDQQRSMMALGCLFVQTLMRLHTQKLPAKVWVEDASDMAPDILLTPEGIQGARGE